MARQYARDKLGRFAGTNGGGGRSAAKPYAEQRNVDIFQSRISRDKQKLRDAIAQRRQTKPDTSKRDSVDERISRLKNSIGNSQSELSFYKGFGRK